MSTPTCKQCGKKLLKRWYTSRTESTSAMPEAPKTFGDRPVLEAKEVSLAYGKTNYYSHRVWLGDYGYRGNGYFCSVTCGYRYGVTAARYQNGFRAGD